MTSDPVPPAPRKAALVFIFITAVLDVLALGIVIPVLAPLIKSFLAGDTKRASDMVGLFGTVWALMQFVCSPILGALSDRFGRRPVILLSCVGLGLDYFLMALAPSLAWLFVGRILSGITAASFSTAGAYIADVTPPDKRAGAFGLLGAAFGLGFVLGPAMGGFLGAFSPRLPFWVAGTLSLLSALYGLFILPESLPPERRAPFSWTRSNPLGSFALLRTQSRLLGLAGLNFLYHLSHQVFPSVFVLYAGHRYGWGEQTVGLVLAAVGICSIAVQAGVVRPFVARFGERSALLVGLLFGTAGFALYGLAAAGSIFWLGVPVFAPIGLFGPALQGLMTRRVGPSEQGRLQGAQGSIMGIAGILGPGLFTVTFSRFLASDMPGAPFLLAGLLLVLAMPLAWATTRP